MFIENTAYCDSKLVRADMPRAVAPDTALRIEAVA